MSNRPSGNEIRLTQQARAFIQYGGALPSQPAYFYGIGTNYNVINAVTNPRNGTVNPHFVGSPSRPGEYRLVARTKAPPPLPAFTLQAYEKRGALNRILKESCVFTAYLACGDCKDLSDLINGWTDKIEVYADGIIGVINQGNRSEINADNPVMNTIPATAREIYEIGQMGFGLVGASQVVTEITDVVYGTAERCAGCGNPNDGTRWAYAIQKHITDASLTPDDAATVLYSTDYGATWTSASIAGITSSSDPDAIDIVGDKLVVVVGSENAYYYATINEDTGVPGAFTKVTTGFTALKYPRDIYVISANEFYLCGDGGYVYKGTDITSGVSVVHAGSATTVNLARIHGVDNTIVAAGASGKVLKSINRGLSWAVTSSDAGAATHQALAVLSSSLYWVGNASGAVYYTTDGGSNWTAKTLSDSPSDIRDIVFVNNEVGWVLGGNGSAGQLFWTPDGGRDWSGANDAPRVVNMPTSADFVRGNRIAIPSTSNSEVAANYALIGGLGLGTDGALILGSPSFF